MKTMRTMMAQVMERQKQLEATADEDIVAMNEKNETFFRKVETQTKNNCMNYRKQLDTNILEMNYADGKKWHWLNN